jgi:type VI secretion system protein ImpG
VTLHESLLLHTELERRLPGISAVYVTGDERSAPQPLVRENGERSFDFGRRRSASDRLSVDRGPALAQVRRLFHFPEEWLFLNLELPPHAPGWTHLELRFASWPDAPRMSASDFHLHVVPVENVQRSPARPIEHRGLVSRYPILHPEAGGGFELLSLRGVYRNTPDSRVPLLSHLLHGNEDHYSLESGDAPDDRTHIAIHAVDAFDEPLRVSIDALWHQPNFQLPGGSEIAIETPGRDAARVQWRPHGALRPHADSPLREEGSDLAQLLWLKMKPVLDCEGVLMLLRALGSFEQSIFQPMAEMIEDLQAVPAPSSDEHTVVVYRYRLLLGDYPETDRALAYRLSQQIWNLITHWTADGLIELRVDPANGDSWLLPSPAAEGPGHWETLG